MPELRFTRTHKKHLDYQVLERRQLLATLNVTTLDDVIDSNDGLLSLREAIVESNLNLESDTIVLSEGTYGISIEGFGEDAGLTGDFDIGPDNDNSLRLVGQGTGVSFIDGNQLDRVFQVHFKSNVTFENMWIRGGDVTQESIETGRRGAAIWSSHAILNVDNVVVAGNEAGYQGVGGGLYVAGGEFSITHSVINLNHAGRDGSAIFSRSAVGSINLSVFNTNKTDVQHRGAIYVGQGELSLNRSKIDRNQGVGVFVFESELSVVHSRFLANHGQFYEFGWTENFGGNAIAAKDANVDIVDSRFTRNSGNAIHFWENNRELNVTDSLFLQNTHYSILFDGKDLDVSNTDLLGETADSESTLAPSRVAIVVSSDTTDPELEREITIVGCNIERHDGEAIRIVSTENNVSLLVRDCQLIDNSLGGVSVGRGLPHSINAEARNVTIRNTLVDGTYRGAGIFVAVENFDLLDSQVTNSVAGGVSIFARQARIYNSTVSQNVNYAGERGGGVSFGGEDSTLEIVNSVISDNMAGLQSSAPARGRGGALHVSSLSANVSIVSSTIVKNRATQMGGAFSVSSDLVGDNNTTIAITNSILWQNFAPVDPIYSGPEGAITVTFSDIKDDDPDDSEIPFGGLANNNIDDRPLFVDYVNNNFRLQIDSPAIDVGDSSALPADMFDLDDDGDTTEPTPDLDLLDRIFGSDTDMGAFEFTA